MLYIEATEGRMQSQDHRAAPSRPLQSGTSRIGHRRDQMEPLMQGPMEAKILRGVSIAIERPQLPLRIQDRTNGGILRRLPAQWAMAPLPKEPQNSFISIPNPCSRRLSVTWSLRRRHWRDYHRDPRTSAGHRRDYHQDPGTSAGLLSPAAFQRSNTKFPKGPRIRGRELG